MVRTFVQHGISTSVYSNYLENAGQGGHSHQPAKLTWLLAQSRPSTPTLRSCFHIFLKIGIQNLEMKKAFKIIHINGFQTLFPLRIPPGILKSKANVNTVTWEPRPLAFPCPWQIPGAPFPYKHLQYFKYHTFTLKHCIYTSTLEFRIVNWRHP